MTTRRLMTIAAAALAFLAATCADPVVADTPNGTDARAGFPTDATTGPSARGIADEHGLPRCPGHPTSGSWTLPAGAHLTDCRVDTKLNVNNPGVVLNGVTQIMTAATAYPIQIGANGGGLIIRDSILGMDPTVGPYPGSTYGASCEANIGFGNYTLERVELYGCIDAGKIAGTVIIRDSYVHDEEISCGGPAGDPCSHNDAFQKDLTSTALPRFELTGSAIYRTPCKGNRALQIRAMGNPGGTYLDVSGSFFYGLHGVINTGPEATSGITGPGITGNTIAGTLTAGPFTPPPNGPGDVFSTDYPGTGGNVFEDGTTVPTTGNLAAGYTCDTTPPPTTTTTTSSTTTTVPPSTTTTLAPCGTTTTTEGT